MKTLKDLKVSSAPWRITDFVKENIGICSEDGWRVCYVRDVKDAYLIQALPDICNALMLAVGSCKTCKADCSTCINPNKFFMPSVRKAIAKATGEFTNEQ